MTIRLKGRIDSNNAPGIEREIAKQLAGQPGAPVEVDASGLEYISSAGLRVLLSAQKKLAGDGRVVIRNANELVMEVFEVTGFVDILTIE